LRDDQRDAREVPEERTLAFSDEQSLGSVYLRPWGETGDDGWRSFEEAQSVVTIPAGQQILLEFATTDPLALATLAEFAPDALQSLDHSMTPFTDDQLIYLRGLIGLRELDLTDTRITDAGLRHLRPLVQLRRLLLGETNVTALGLAHLSALPRLRFVDIGNMPIADTTKEWLDELLPGCIIEGGLVVK
jgi:hypothetical protein